jgi:hypothetical protein
MKRSAVILTQARLLVIDRERLAMMTTFIHFFKRLIHHDEICPVPDALLRDIGLSRVLMYLP